MKILESIISFLQFEMERPTMYGWFHILSLIIVVLLTIILVKKCRNERKLLLIMSVIMILFEVYKQISFSFDDGIWEYEWYLFPFQFCSVPMYVAFLVYFVKNEKWKKGMYMFLASYGLIAGILVMLYPSTVFISEVLINIQTMVHHGFMVVIGTYLILTNKIKLTKENMKYSVLIFLIIVSIALVGDIVSYYIGLDDGLELFYISPYHTPILPIFDNIYQHVPYILFLSLYIGFFSIGSIIPYSIISTIKKLKENR